MLYVHVPILDWSLGQGNQEEDQRREGRGPSHTRG